MPYIKQVAQSDDGFKVHYISYKAKPDPHTHRTVIIFPPTGGTTYLERSYTKGLLKKGVDVKLLSHWSGQNEESLDVHLHQRLHERAMKALQLVIESCPSNHKISLLGTSVGAIFTAVAANKFEKLDRVFSIAGGIPIPEVIAFSDYKTMKSLRKRRMKKFNFKNKETYTQAIDKEFQLDPKDLTPLFKTKRKGLVVLLKDKSVPTKNQLELKAYWKPEKVITLKSGHFLGIVRAWWLYYDEIIDFLSEK